MQYGAKGIKWAPIKTEPATALPTYDAAISLGALNKVSETVNFNEASGYGDNVLKVSVKEFRDGSLAVEVTELTNDNAAKLSGSTVEEVSKDTHFNGEDDAPYGGVAFFINKIKDNGQKVYQGIFYPKVKANLEGEEYTTKGESITLANSKLSLKVFACNNGDWKIKSDDLTTEAEAIAWVAGKLAAQT